MAAIFLFLIINSAIFIHHSHAAEEEETFRVIPNVGHHYPVHIGAESHIVQGRISSKAEPGSLVPSNVIAEGDDDANTGVHLRVEVRKSIYKRPHIYHPDTKLVSNDPQNPLFEHPIIEFVNSTLPYGMHFVVDRSDAFYVNDDRYIAVNDFTKLNGESIVHFHIILMDTLMKPAIHVSNQLPFVVEIEYPVRERTPEAALFAGVLILTIIAISLVIPFVVRAKRRSKAGKPICGCGSADDNSETDSMNSVPDFVKNRAMSIGGKENLAFVLENGRLKQHRPSIDQHMTIQDRMLRSTSNLNFQPHWLDPHYSEVYDRPDFDQLQQNQLQPHVPAKHSGHTNGAHRLHNGHSHGHTHGVSSLVNGHHYIPHSAGSLYRPMAASSARSSTSSVYKLPVTFSLGASPLNAEEEVKPTKSGAVETGNLRNTANNITIPAATAAASSFPINPVAEGVSTVVVVHEEGAGNAESNSDIVHNYVNGDVYALPGGKSNVNRHAGIENGASFSSDETEMSDANDLGADGGWDDSRDEIIIADERL